jgi:pantoate--beta-alanine ligase
LKTITTISELQSTISEIKKLKKTIAFVPTMGALHEGHLSLFQQPNHAKADVVFASIFVNPKQFNQIEDLEKYPRNLSADEQLLSGIGVDYLFAPTVEEMYPSDYQEPGFSFGYLEEILEGAFRPGHFKGVGVVVSRLLELIQPNFLCMGEKDLQQCKVVASLLQQMEVPSEILVVLPTVREESGLAMSSRNMRLSNSGKEKASEIFKTMIWVKENFSTTDWETLAIQGKERLELEGFQVEYFEIRHWNSLLPLQNNSQKGVLLVAAYLEGIRLIDNLALSN